MMVCGNMTYLSVCGEHKEHLSGQNDKIKNTPKGVFFNFTVPTVFRWGREEFLNLPV